MFRYLLLLETDEEREFFKFIYQEYRQEMFCVARAILKNEADAEDMVHETFLILTDHLNKIINSESYKVRDYIITTVRHRCFNLYRKRKIQECSGLGRMGAGRNSGKRAGYDSGRDRIEGSSDRSAERAEISLWRSADSAVLP